MSKVEQFHENLKANDILLPEGIHHEFVKGGHGRKIDFDRIEAGTELFDQWTDVCAEDIDERFPERPGITFIIGVANGTNRTAPHIAEKLDRPDQRAVSLLTEKVDSRTALLTLSSRQLMRLICPTFIFVTEDVGTSGHTSSTTVEDTFGLLKVTYGFDDDFLKRMVHVQNTWQRTDELPDLDDMGVDHWAIINERIPTYSKNDCNAFGHCADKWELVEHA